MSGDAVRRRFTGREESSIRSRRLGSGEVRTEGAGLHVRVVGKVQEGAKHPGKVTRKGLNTTLKKRQLGKDWMCELVLKYLETGK